jgi:hypothetical protein
MRRAAVAVMTWGVTVAPLLAHSAHADDAHPGSTPSAAAGPAAGAPSAAASVSPSAAPSAPPAAPASSVASPGAEQLQFAAHEHDFGYRAYVAKDFDEAATHFENAFFAAPNPLELRNAIRARRAGRELARAATLAAIGQRRFAGDAATIKLSEETIAEARPAVLEIQIESADGFTVAVDDKVVIAEKARSARFFTGPGRHELLVSWADDRNKRTTIEGHEGSTQSLFLEAPPSTVPAQPPPVASTTVPPPPPPPAPTIVAPPPAPPPPPAVVSNKPFSPTTFVAVAGLTVVGAGATAWSGLDAESNPGQAAVRRECVGQGESCDAYRTGVAAQLRTNVLLGVTGVLAVSSAVIGVFFTDWSGGRMHASGTGGPATPRIATFVGLGSAGLLGTF